MLFRHIAGVLVRNLPPTTLSLVLMALDDLSAQGACPCPAERGIAQALCRAIREARD